MILVDTNILLDLLTNDSAWFEWSVEALDQAALSGPLMINDVIYAEVSSRFTSMEPLDEFVEATRLQVVPMPRAALFLAAKAYRRYRASGGLRTGVLPDFFIGAQAAVSGYTLLTRDISRYRTYFPEVRLIAPQLN